MTCWQTGQNHISSQLGSWHGRLLHKEQKFVSRHLQWHWGQGHRQISKVKTDWRVNKNWKHLMMYRKVEIITHSGIVRIIVRLSSLSICIWYCKWKQKSKGNIMWDSSNIKDKHECISCKSLLAIKIVRLTYTTVIFKQIQTLCIIRQLGATKLASQPSNHQ